MEPSELLRRCVEVLERLHIPDLVTGSMATIPESGHAVISYRSAATQDRLAHSHSIVPGGLLVTS
jgi:hypothetical protein